MAPTWARKLISGFAVAAVAAALAGCGGGASGAAESGVAVCDDLVAEYFPGELSDDPIVSALQVSRFELGLPHDVVTAESLTATELGRTEEEDQWWHGLSNTEDAVAVAVGVPLQEYADLHLDSHVLTRYVRDGDRTSIVVSFTQDLAIHEAAINEIVGGRYEVIVTEGQHAHADLRRAQDHMAANTELMAQSTGTGRQRMVGPNQVRAPVYFETLDGEAHAAVAEGVDPQFHQLICLEQLERPRG